MFFRVSAKCKSEKKNDMLSTEWGWHMENCRQFRYLAKYLAGLADT